MKFFIFFSAVVLTTLLTTPGCGQKSEQAEQPTKAEETMNWQAKADSFLAEYETALENVYVKSCKSEWEAETTGKKEAYDALAAADLEYKKLHSDAGKYAQLTELLKNASQLNPQTQRALTVTDLDFKENQLPPDTLKKLVNGETEIKQIFTNFRGKMDGKEYANNDLTESLKAERSTPKRQKMWEALKQVGDAVSPKLIALARERNAAAQSLGFKNYWDMKIRIQDHNPDQLIAIFSELETSTNEPFRKMKAVMDQELAKRFGIKADAMMPWHYDNPFFQAAPPSAKVNMDEFYKKKQKEELIGVAQKFFSDINLPVEDIVGRSDLYQREGKNQHAFCTSIDRKGDVRILVNIIPTADEMDTTLHELGHAVYDKFIDPALPFILREPSHAFTTEAIAMLFGALAKNPAWIVSYTNADPKRVQQAEPEILEQRRREQLIFARWTMVMFNFEKSFYENPDQDLNTLWWDIVERFQMLKRPQGRNAADWAAKPHFTIAPVYYHNYMLGELFAAQLRNTMAKLVNHQGPAHTLKYQDHKELGVFLREKIFKPANTKQWAEFIKDATGEPLTAKFFAMEVQ